MSAFMHAARVLTVLRPLLVDMVEQHGQPISELGIEAGIPPTRLQHLLDDLEVPTVAELFQLGQVLGFKPSDLLVMVERRIERESAAAAR